MKITREKLEQLIEAVVAEADMPDNVPYAKNRARRMKAQNLKDLSNKLYRLYFHLVDFDPESEDIEYENSADRLVWQAFQDWSNPPTVEELKKAASAIRQHLENTEKTIRTSHHDLNSVVDELNEIDYNKRHPRMA